MVVSNRNLLFQWSIFRGYVSFREGRALRFFSNWGSLALKSSFPTVFTWQKARICRILKFLRQKYDRESNKFNPSRVPTQSSITKNFVRYLKFGGFPEPEIFGCFGNGDSLILSRIHITLTYTAYIEGEDEPSILGTSIPSFKPKPKIDLRWWMDPFGPKLGSLVSWLFNQPPLTATYQYPQIHSRV